jgi:hypothetical protein
MISFDMKSGTLFSCGSMRWGSGFFIEGSRAKYIGGYNGRQSGKALREGVAGPCALSHETRSIPAIANAFDGCDSGRAAAGVGEYAE